MYPEVALNAPQSRMQQRIIDDFGGGEKVLPWLKSMGVDSIELRMLNGKLTLEEYLRFVDLVWDTGLALTVHGVMPKEAPQTYLAMYDQLLRKICDRQEKTVFTVHSMATQPQTRACFAALAEALKAYPGLMLSLENQRIHDDLHDHYSVVQVAQNAADYGAGMTWDMGHYMFNVRTTPDVIPPEAALKRVIHTHIHSISSNGDTHHHLCEEPARSYIGALQACGYAGIYNLELFAKTYPETSSPRKTLEEAIVLLQDMLK